MASKELKDKFEKVCSQGQQIQKTLKYHQNKLKSLVSNPKTDSTTLEAAINKLSVVYSDLGARINQDYPQLKFNFFPSNMEVSYSVKYAGGTFPDDLTLCHTKKSRLKEVRSSLKRKIISKELSKVSCVEERDCVIAIDMKRTVVRGVVIGVSHQIVKLLDIDTGDYKNAVVDNIYELDEEAVSLYALCVRCGLDGDLTDLKEFWTTDLSHYFISALNYGELVIETSHDVDESSIPPRFKVTIEVFVDDNRVLNVNHWVCKQLLPLVKKEAQNCLDLQKVIQGLDPKVLMPYLVVASGVSINSSSNLSDSCVCSSQIISSPESSARSSSSESSEEFSVDIQIDKFDKPSFLPSPSTAVNGPTLSSGKKEIDVYFTNENMVASPSSESLVAERSKSKCDCGTDCAPIVGCCPPELLQSNPKVPRITTVIPSLASIPHDTGGNVCASEAELHPSDAVDPCPVTSNPISNSNLPPQREESLSVLEPPSEPHDLNDGEPFYYKMKNKSKSSLLPTPSTTQTNTSVDNKSETELRNIESAFYNKSNGRLPPDGIKHRSDNLISCSTSSTSSRRGPRSHIYTLPLPSYMTEAEGFAAVNASAGDAFVAGVGYPEEKLVPLPGAGVSGPNSRGEGLSLKPQHFCLAGHLDKVQSVKLPTSVLLVEPGQERKALISFTETPSKFFVNIVDENNSHLEQLEEELCAHYSQVNNLVSLVTIEEAKYHLGEYVAAKWKSDGRWYRARVIDWNVYDKNSIAILYVDHGNVDFVPLDYIQPLDPHFSQYAIMALPCHLDHLSPASSSGWSQGAIEMFSQFCDKPIEVFYLTFQPSSSNDSFCSWSVVMRNAQGECINDLLVSAGHAVHTSKINGYAPPAQPPTPLTPAPSPDREHNPLLSKIQGLVKQIQNKNANINSALETNSNMNSVHEVNSDSPRYEISEPCDKNDSNNYLGEIRDQLVPDTFDKFDNSCDLIDLTTLDEQTVAHCDISHHMDLNTNRNNQIGSCDKPINIDNIRNEDLEPQHLTNKDQKSLNQHSKIVSVSKPCISASLSVRRYLNSQYQNNSCNTNIPAPTVPISYKACNSGVTASPRPQPGDILIPGLGEDLVDRTITGTSRDQTITVESSPENHGRLSRNSNISCVSSEGLHIVEQMLNICSVEIEKNSQRLSKALEIKVSSVQHLVDNEKKLAENERKLSEMETLAKEKPRNEDELIDLNNEHRNRNNFDNALDVKKVHRDMSTKPKNDEIGVNHLDKDVGENEVKELNVARTKETRKTKPLLEVKELNVPRSESPQLLNNNVPERSTNTNPMNQDKRLNNTSYNNSERIVNRLKSPIPHVLALKNTNYKHNSDRNTSYMNQYKINSENHPSMTNQYQNSTYNTNTECNLPNTKPYKSQLEYNPSHTAYHNNYTPYPTIDNYPTHQTNEKEEILSGIDENLNENLLVSSSESSVRRGKLPPITKKTSRRKPVEINFNTILTKMPANETEKQKMIEEFVDNSLQQAKQSGNIVDDNLRREYNNSVALDSKPSNNAKQGFYSNDQTYVHSESKNEKVNLEHENNRQNSNKYNLEYCKGQYLGENRLINKGDNKNVLYDSNLNQDLLPDHNDINQLEPKDQVRLNNQLEPKFQDRMLNDEDIMSNKNRKRGENEKEVNDDQDRLQENENRITSHDSDNVKSKKEVMPKDQDRSAKDHHRPLSEELAVKKKISSRGRPRKYFKHSDDPGPSLKSLGQKGNIFECLNQVSNSNSADVSSEETSSDVPSTTPQARPSKSNSHKTEQLASTLTNTKNNTSSLSKTSNTAYISKHSKPSAITDGAKDNNAAQRSNPSPSDLSNASSKSFTTHNPGHKSEESASMRKTQKWFWLTLHQEPLLKPNIGKTIKVKVMRIPSVGEFYCQPVGVFPEYELGFKTLFFNSNTPQVHSQFKPMPCIRPGKLVMVCDPNSNKWYRSSVQDKVEGQDLFKVFFVDFGTEAFVPSSSIREIQPDYTRIPYQAIHCRLHNIRVCPNPEFVKSEEYIKYLRVWSEMLRVGQTYETKIMEVDSNLVSVSLEDSDGFDMGELLALSCSTEFVELKSNTLQGAWADFVHDY